MPVPSGLPLALELAAARTRVLAPRQILDRMRTLAEPFGPGRRDAPERHRTLQATIDWSLNLLTPDQQRLFAVLGLFVGGFTVDAAADGVCRHRARSAGRARRRYSTTASCSEYSPRRPRLGMLEPIREYALRRLRADASIHRSALVRHAQYYAALPNAPRTAFKAIANSNTWTSSTMNSETSARSYGANSQPGLDLALRITCALGRFWIMRDLVAEIRAWLKWALNQPPGDPIIRTRALVDAGLPSLVPAGISTRGERRSSPASPLNELGDAALTARSEATLAWSLYEQGDNESAADHAERALNLAARTRDPWTEATC